jgi:hypothetical protein
LAPFVMPSRSRMPTRRSSSSLTCTPLPTATTLPNSPNTPWRPPPSTWPVG